MSEPLRDENRCAICGWPMGGHGKGIECDRGNCSMRPFPDRYYDPERAAREYGPALPPERNPYIGSPEYQIATLTAQLAEAQRELNEHRATEPVDMAGLTSEFMREMKRRAESAEAAIHIERARTRKAQAEVTALRSDFDQATTDLATRAERAESEVTALREALTEVLNVVAWNCDIGRWESDETVQRACASAEALLGGQSPTGGQ